LALQKTGRQRLASRGNLGELNVPGTRAGAIVSIGLVVVSWLTIPIARPFILGAMGAGLIVGLILSWKRRHPVHPEDESLVPHRRK
jgi:hypothetical protein